MGRRPIAPPRRYRKETRARLELFQLPDDVLNFGQEISYHLESVFRDPLIARGLIPLLRARART